jgi:hypothetical protein
MGILLLFLLGMGLILIVPVITALFAKRVGRSPVKWFFISMVLPLIATFLLFLLPDLSEEKTN